MTTTTLAAPPSQSTTKATFPEPKQLSEMLARFDGMHGSATVFAQGHDAMLEGTKSVLQAVQSYGDSIPAPVARVLGDRISHLLNANNMVFEHHHHGARRDLTLSAQKSLSLVLTSPNAETRTLAAELGLLAIEALHDTVKKA